MYLSKLSMYMYLYACTQIMVCYYASQDLVTQMQFCCLLDVFLLYVTFQNKREFEISETHYLWFTNTVHNAYSGENLLLFLTFVQVFIVVINNWFSTYFRGIWYAPNHKGKRRPGHELPTWQNSTSTLAFAETGNIHIWIGQQFPQQLKSTLTK